MKEKNEEMQAGQIFDMTDDDGNTFTFELLDFVSLDEVLYAVLSTVDDNDEDSEDLNVVIMYVEYEGDEPIFTLVEDEDLCQQVIEAFTELYEEDEE